MPKVDVPNLVAYLNLMNGEHRPLVTDQPVKFGSKLI